MGTIHRRTCSICEANCGVLVETEGRQVLSIKGNPEHVLSQGHICPKATALADLQSDPDRLRQPVRRVGEDWVPVSWEEAFADIGRRFAAIEDGATALYLGNPTAHNYAVTTQMRALRKALGVRGLYSASTVDQIPHQLVQYWMYGHNALFPIPDVDRAHTFLMVGANPLASNGSVWTVPGVRQRLKALQRRGGQLIVVDPRRTETAKIADAHHFIRPGGDAAFLAGLLLALEAIDGVRPGRLTPILDEGWQEAWTALRTLDGEALSRRSGVSSEVLGSIAEALSSSPAPVVYGRLGVSTQRHGTLNLWLIQLLNIALGSLDREGGAMFSTPAVDLVASTNPGTYDRFRTRVGDHPEVLSELPAATLSEEILTPGEGQIRGLVVFSGNPVLSTPGGHRLDAALADLEIMVSVDMYVTETSRHADYILPPCGPLEKDHFGLVLGPIAVRNFACYSSPTLPKEDDALDDWQIVRRLAGSIGKAKSREVPDLPEPRAVLDLSLQASGHALSLAALEAKPNGVDLGPLESRLPERLRTPDRQIRCAPPACLAALKALAQEPVPAAALVLIGRRHLRSNNSWLHNSHRLVKGPNRCTAMMNPSDAADRGLSDGQLVAVTSRVGEIQIPVEITEDVGPGTVSIPHGFGHDRDGVQLSVAAAHAGASLNDLTDPSRLDPLSGNAAFSGTPIEVRAL